MIYVLLLGLLMFIRFAERGAAVFYDLCVIGAKLIRQQTDKISQQPENWENALALTWYRHFQRNLGLNQILRRQTSHFHYG